MSQGKLFGAKARLGEVEAYLSEQGVLRVIGVDEAGRGPLAGPVVVAAVCLPPGISLEGLDDSKKLTERRREALFAPIQEKALAYSIVEVTPAQIDELNILQATFWGMRATIEEVLSSLGEGEKDRIVIDGNRVPTWKEGAPSVPLMPVVKGDQRSLNVAAASVLAKVHRDRLMVALDARFPGYGFAKHKGYPTAAHREAVSRLGPCVAHRRSFKGVREHLEVGPSSSTAKGARGEEAAWAYLESKGWRLLARNWKGSGGEIDLIVEKEALVAFVEVRAHKGPFLPELSVSAAKARRIEAAAGSWLAARGGPSPQVRFDVIGISPKEEGGASLRHYPNAFTPQVLFF